MNLKNSFPSCPPTITEVVKQFNDVWGLSKTPAMRHEGLHAMTALGISFADELRVFVIERALYQISESVAISETRRVHKAITSTPNRIISKLLPSVVKESKWANRKSWRAEKKSQTLAIDEIKELHKLGLKIGQEIINLTGKWYTSLTREEIGNLDLSLLDFSEQVYAIKSRHDKPQNMRAEENLMDAFAENAAAKGHVIAFPAAGSPWRARISRSAQAVSPTSAAA